MSFRFEVWDPPGIATFERKIASLPTISASGTVYRRQTGRGSATIPGDYPRLDDVITVDPANHANDVASTIRVYRYDDWCQDLVVKSSPNLVAGEDATLTLDGIETVLDWAVVEAWDWDGTADFVSEFPDWVYGGRNLLVDPSLSESVCEPRISEFWTDATSGQWRVNVDGQTVDIDFDATASEVTTAYESLSTVTDVRVEGNGSAETPWRVTFVEPCFPATTYTVTTNTLNAPINAGLIQLGSEQAPGWTEAQPLFGNTLYGVYDAFEVATLPAATPAGTTEGLKFDGQAPVGFSFPGAQTVPAVTPGALVQGGVWVYVDAAGSYPMRLVLRTPSEEPMIASSTFPSTTVTGQTWTLLSFADATIPEWIDRAIFRVSYVGTADPPDIYVADAYLREGMAEATVGYIMGELLDDAQTDHAAAAFPRATITFINKTFTDSLDSAGNAWDSDVFVSIPRGMTYRKVLERIFGQLGYEWSVTPTSGTPGEWDLNIWNPDGRGTDYSSADTPSILFGQGTESGSATRTLPPGNIVISEGAGYYTSRAANSASYGTIGRREWWQTDISYQQTQVDSWTDRQLARFLSETLNPRFEIADPPAGSSRPVPLIDFGLADTMNVDLATGGGKVSRQVEAISWRTVDDGIMFGVQLGDTQFDNIGGFSGGGSGGSVDMAAMGPVNEGVRRLIDAFKRPQFQSAASSLTPGGRGSDPSVFVAASDATDYEKSVANFVCDGTADDIEIMQAFAAVDRGLANPKGRVVLSSGIFYVRGGELLMGGDIHLHGMGILSTEIRCSDAGATTLEIDDSAANFQISDMTISAQGTGTTTCLHYFGALGIIERVWFFAGTRAIYVEDGEPQIINCVSEGTNYALLVNSGRREIQVLGSHFEGILDFDTAVGVKVVGNKFEGTVRCSDPRGVTIADNVWEGLNYQLGTGAIVLGGEGGVGDGHVPGCVVSGNVVAASTEFAVDATSVDALVIVGNVFYEGSVRVTGDDALVADNQSWDTYDQGAAFLMDGNRNTLKGNRFATPVNGSAGAGTDDAFAVDGDDNLVEGNYSVPSPFPSFPTRSAVNVRGGNRNVVVGNHLGDASEYGTAALIDSGTSTVTTYPAGADGDNFSN